MRSAGASSTGRTSVDPLEAEQHVIAGELAPHVLQHHLQLLPSLECLQEIGCFGLRVHIPEFSEFRDVALFQNASHACQPLFDLRLGHRRCILLPWIRRSMGFRRKLVGPVLQSQGGFDIPDEQKNLVVAD